MTDELQPAIIKENDRKKLTAVQWDDILDENRDDALNQKYSIWCDEHLDINQALISLKKGKDIADYSINREYINSYEYQAKFEKLLLRKDVKKALYNETGRLLEFINGLEPEQQLQERLTVINAETGEHVVDNFDRNGEIYQTGLTNEEYQKIIDCPNQIILIHNHSLNTRPSGQDLLSFLHNRDKTNMSIIACHNGDIYAICDVKPIFEKRYDDYLDRYKTQTTDINEAKYLAISDIYDENQVISDRHKIFDVKKL